MRVKGEVVHSPEGAKAYSATLPVKKSGQHEEGSDDAARVEISVTYRPIAVANADERALLRVENWHEVISQTGALTGIARHHLIQSGLHTHLLKEVLDTFQDVSDDQLLAAIGLSTKTLSRRADSRLGPRHSDAAMALIEVTDMAQKVLGSRKLAEEWLTKPALALDGMRPLDLISTTPGIESVKDLLTRMEYGVYA